MRRAVLWAVASATLAASWGARGAEGAALPPLPAGTQRLTARVPGVQVYVHDGRVVALYGRPMNGAGTPEAAALAWLEQNGDAFGVPGLDLRLEGADLIQEGRFTVFTYRQYLMGTPVEFGTARVLVLNGAANTVVYAGAKLAQAPERGLAEPRLDAAGALRALQKEQRFAALAFAQPELVVFYGEGDRPSWIPAVRCWKIGGFNGDNANPYGVSVFIDAATGAVVQVRDEIHRTDIVGTVTGLATPGVRPDVETNPPSSTPIGRIRVGVVGGGTSITGVTGEYAITHEGVEPVAVATNLGLGEWSRVVPRVGPALSASRTVIPPGPADLLINPAPAEHLTSQVNAMLVVTRTHDYFKDRAPTFTGLDIPLTTNVNLAATCNAFFTNAGGLSVNFYGAGNGCVNTAYSTIVSHEYGHFVVNRRNLAQEAFGEGFGDTLALMVWDTPVGGQDLRGPGTYVRDVEAANQQYPCAGPIHLCGQVLAGTWWDIRRNFGAAFGSEPGLEMARQRQVAWAMITLGGEGGNSASPRTAVEVLMVDDDDGNLANGTPNYGLICPAFARHGIACPAVQMLDFRFPDGRPSITSPTRPTVIRVTVAPITASPEPGTGTVFYRSAGGSFASVPMTEAAPNQYDASIPAQPCEARVEYYFRAMTADGRVQLNPADAPISVYSAVSAFAESTVADLNFETDPTPGWTVTNEPGLTTGAWERGRPEGAGLRNDPPRDYDGSGQCWLTENRFGNFDVDGGPTRLTTPAYDLTGGADYHVSYARWILSSDGERDALLIEVSADDGVTWGELETVPTEARGWVARDFRIADVVPVTATVRFRFSVSDNPSDSMTEAAIDAFRVYGFDCRARCPVDLDGDGAVTVQDFLGYLQLFAAGAGRADLNQDGTINIQDFLAFLSAFSAGC
jgi:hypothetical protein